MELIISVNKLPMGVQSSYKCVHCFVTYPAPYFQASRTVHSCSTCSNANTHVHSHHYAQMECRIL
jgi:hypothetical protein